MSIYASEITSENHVADNPIHQRLLKAYYEAIPFIKGTLLEIGCGEGRGIELLAPKAEKYIAIDKIAEIQDYIKNKHNNIEFHNITVPPLTPIHTDSVDTVVTFQVIEHIKDDNKYLEEIFRVLKPGGKAIISTPNINLSLTRNPWHEREYTPTEFINLCKKYFTQIEAYGITGNDKVWQYYNENKKSVEKITRWDILGLQHKLPNAILRIPYDIMNRRNRNKLRKGNTTLSDSICLEDFVLTKELDKSFDFFFVLTK
jgi:SAM-dependent methyltransferase